MEHGTGGFCDYSILSFNNSILLRSVWNGCLPLNANLSAKVIEFILFIFGSIVNPQYFDLLPCLILHQGFERTEPSEHFILLLQEIDPCSAREVIHKDNII